MSFESKLHVFLSDIDAIVLFPSKVSNDGKGVDAGVKETAVLATRINALVSKVDGSVTRSSAGIVDILGT